MHALRDLDLDILQGEFVVFLDPSGSGKSTLLNILGSLDVPTTGRAAWRDHELTGADQAALTAYRSGHVGLAFQFCNLIGRHCATRGGRRGLGAWRERRAVPAECPAGRRPC
ncbi:ATP-binding cassette domain-containing protein [Sediminicoccus sp. BL-A-41-H5]|uniref:ATP-binding cassette domain-containing protein n=1 Tax=Sediminicoccus sp. BL-A-41-H5 TaxID=3421106 RepID=UPI003D6695E8